MRFCIRYLQNSLNLGSVLVMIQLFSVLRHIKPNSTLKKHILFISLVLLPAFMQSWISQVALVLDFHGTSEHCFQFSDCYLWLQMHFHKGIFFLESGSSLLYQPWSKIILLKFSNCLSLVKCTQVTKLLKLHYSDVMNL